MVGKIRSWFPQIENVFVDPIPYDGGLSILDIYGIKFLTITIIWEDVQTKHICFEENILQNK